MPSTYSSNLKIELMSTGENSGTWGNITNTNLGTALEQAVVGYGAVSYASDANLTISITNSNAAQAARALVLNVTSAVSLTATRELVVPTIEKQYIVQNNTTGSQSITVKTSAGTGITVPNGRKAHLYVDGTNVIQMFDFVDINGGTIDGTPIGGSSAAAGAFTTLNASGATTLDGNVTLGNAAGDNITFSGTITSHLLFTDNTYDIGANGATRPRNLFLAGAATIGGNLSVGGTLTLTGGVNLNGNVTVGDNASDTLTINSTITSNLLFTDNTYDIGASGATRPRNLFLAGNATIGGNVTTAGRVIVDDTTDSSSATTGSIQTDGGVGIAKGLYVGGNTTLGDATTDTLAVNALVNSNLLFTDNTYDIGASGATRPRNLYLSGNAVVGGNTTLGDSSVDTVTVNATITSNLAFTDNTYDIGLSGTSRPRYIYTTNNVITTKSADPLHQVIGNSANSSAGFLSSLDNGTTNWFAGTRSDANGGTAGSYRYNILAASTNLFYADAGLKFGLASIPATSWDASAGVLELGNNGGASYIVTYGTLPAYFGRNYYYDGANAKFRQTGYAQEYGLLSDGGFQWTTFGTGSAAATATATVRAKFTRDGIYYFGANYTTSGPGIINVLSPDTGTSFQTNRAMFCASASVAGREVPMLYGTDGTAISLISMVGGTIGIFNTASGTPSQNVTILANGKVGIGDTNPANLLTVNNQGVSGVMAGFYANVDAGANVRLRNSASSSAANASFQLVNDATKYLEIGIQSSTRSADYPANTGWIYTTTDLTIGKSGNFINLQTGSTNRVVVSTGGTSQDLLYINAGSSAPTSANGDITIDTTAASGASRFTFKNSGTSVGSVAYSHDNNQLELIGWKANSKIAFVTNGGQKGVIDAGGALILGAASLPGGSSATTSFYATSSDSTSANWTSRVVSGNTAGAKATFMGVYRGGSSGPYYPTIAAHNSGLTAWADLYVNTVDPTSVSASVFMPPSVAIGYGSMTWQSNTWTLLVKGDSANYGYGIKSLSSGIDTYTQGNYNVHWDGTNIAFYYGVPGSGSTRFTFDSSGNAAKSSGAGTWNATSDIRVKTNIQKVSGGLSRIRQLIARTFDYKCPEAHNGRVTDKGFIADEFMQVYPNSIVEVEVDRKGDQDAQFIEEGGKIKQMGFNAEFFADLVDAMQTLANEIEQLKGGSV